MQLRFNWPLMANSITCLDRARIAWWMLTQNQFTMGPRVAKLEAKMGQLAGAHALMVANGSLANQLVFETWKVKHRDIAPRDAVVIVPAVTWVSSITPVLSLGFGVAFCDVNLDDFSFDYGMLQRLLAKHADRRVIIWPTALVGFCPDMQHLKLLAGLYKADLYLDACENTLAYTDWDQSILASADMVTTSTYFSHQLTSVEGGFVFYHNEDDLVLGRMLRNHGLSRSLMSEWAIARQAIEEANPTVDPSFLFALPGTNLRPTDVHAMFGLQDIRRVDQYRVHRTALYRRFYEGIAHSRYHLPPLTESHVGFCLPIILQHYDGVADHTDIVKLKQRLNELGIATRPLIGGNLLRQPCFKAYGNAADYPNAEYLHTNAAYVGLHAGVTEDMVDGLVEVLNAL